MRLPSITSMSAVHRGFALPLAFALATASVAAQQLPNMPPDNAGGARAHVGYSAAIGGALNLANPERPWLNALICGAIGMAKEVADYRRGQTGYRHGLFSRADLRNDLLGCALGWGTMAGLRLMVAPRGLYLEKEL